MNQNWDLQGLNLWTLRRAAEACFQGFAHAQLAIEAPHAQPLRISDQSQCHCHCQTVGSKFSHVARHLGFNKTSRFSDSTKSHIKKDRPVPLHPTLSGATAMFSLLKDSQACRLNDWSCSKQCSGEFYYCWENISARFIGGHSSWMTREKSCPFCCEWETWRLAFKWRPIEVIEFAIFSLWFARTWWPSSVVQFCFGCSNQAHLAKWRKLDQNPQGCKDNVQIWTM